MTNYATQSDYTAYLSGKEVVIDTASFDFYSRKATQLINTATFGRIVEVTDEIKMCCCRITSYNVCYTKLLREQGKICCVQY